MKYYKCGTCGNVIEFMNASGVPVICCMKKMKELVPGTSDGASEKHVPVITIEGSKVTVAVGSVQHPSTEEHYIQWITLETRKGAQRVTLSPGDVPMAEFYISEDDEVIAAYEYCNLHELWVAYP